MTKLAVTTDPIMLCRYCQNNHGFNNSPARLVSIISPFLPNWYPVGCCIHASVAIMKKPESHEPAKTDRKSTRLNSSHLGISYAVFCLKKKKKYNTTPPTASMRCNAIAASDSEPQQ